MIKAKCVYDIDRVVKLSKGIKIKTISLSAVLSLVILAMGIYNIISANIGKDSQNIFMFILGIIITLFSIYPTYNALRSVKGIVQKTIRDMGVEDGQIILEYFFKDKKVEISMTKNNEVKFDTLMLKNIAYVKVNKKGVAIYLKNDEMYYIEDDEIIEGNRVALINLLSKNNVKIK